MKVIQFSGEVKFLLGLAKKLAKIPIRLDLFQRVVICKEWIYLGRDWECYCSQALSGEDLNSFEIQFLKNELIKLWTEKFEFQVYVKIIECVVWDDRIYTLIISKDPITRDFQLNNRISAY